MPSHDLPADETLPDDHSPGEGSALPAEVGPAETDPAEVEPGLIRRAVLGVGRFFLRAAFAYFVLFAYPFPLLAIPDVRTIPQIWHDRDIPPALVNWKAPDWVDDAYTWRGEHAADWRALERRTVDRVAADVLGFEETLDRPRGSGDVTLGWIKVATRAAAAVSIALLWTLLGLIVGRFTGGRRSLLGWLGPWMHVAGRYYLAMVLLGYGLAKVHPSQFSAPSLARMETPYGDGSPMNILWSFMGSSTAYTIFSGVMEVLPALLLLFRRTALMGALLAAAVMANVVLLNFCYDVPVKILSSHLFLLACALASVDLKRLVSVFLLNRTAAPRDLSRPRTGWFGHGVRVLLVLPYLALAADRTIEKYRHPREPYELRGIWDVERFLVDGEERIPRTDDALRFQALIIDRKGWAHLKTMDGSQRGMKLSPSRSGDRLTLSSSSDWYYRRRGDELVLTGEHLRFFRPDEGAADRRVQMRGPRIELVLRRDPDFVPSGGGRRRRTRVPETLCGRWIHVSTDLMGDVSTRRHSMPFGWDALVIEADGDVTVEYPLSRQEFKVRVEPHESEDDAAPRGPGPDGELSLRSSSRLDLELPGDGRMRLEGELRGNDVEIELRLRDPDSFLLVRRGFHWINEIPLNVF